MKKSKELIGKLEKEKKKRLRLKSEIDNIKEECGDDYYYPSENNLRNLLLEDGEIKKRCLVVTEWTTEKIKNEYSGIKT